MRKIRIDKNLWKTMDRLEGKEEGESIKKFEQEAKRQGYKVVNNKKVKLK